MIKYIYICLIILSFFVDSLFSEPLSPEKGQTHIRPETAAFYGLVPGLGQIINGEYFSAATQVLTFSSAAYLSSYYVRHRDYIHINERKIDFDPFYTYLSNEISARNMYNKDVPAPGIWETEYERRLRFLKEKKMAEQNPLLEYGPYTRINQVSLYAQMAEQTMLHTLFYSVYSAYRDTGVMGEERSKETFASLATAPFDFQILSHPTIWTPIAALAILGASGLLDSQQATLVPKNFHSNGDGAFFTTVVSFNAGVGEEAFFRGYLNHSISRRHGAIAGGFVSGLTFGLAHYGEENRAPVIQTLFGFYAAFLHQINGYDIRPGIALHFWWDIIAIAIELRKYKPDDNFSKNRREVHFMPTLYEYRF